MNLLILKTIKIPSYEMGLYFRDGEFKGLLGFGGTGFRSAAGQGGVVSQRPWLAHEKPT